MLPAAASFRKQGANKGAVASFLVSTPESGIDSIAITYALLDPIMTAARPIAAFITGITAGTLENLFSYNRERKSQEEQASAVVPSAIPMPGKAASTPTATLKTRFSEGMRYAFVDVWGDIVSWFFIGLLIAGAITVCIPDQWSEMALGGGIVSMLSMLILGLPVYICATASTPVAAALLLKGASPGAVLVFLLVGPATNMTSLSVLIKILGKMGTIRYLATIAISALLFGLGIDFLYQALDLAPKALIREAAEIVPSGVKLGSAIILMGLSFYHLYRRLHERFFTGSTTTIVGYPALEPVKHDSQCKKDRCGCK